MLVLNPAWDRRGGSLTETDFPVNLAFYTFSIGTVSLLFLVRGLSLDNQHYVSFLQLCHQFCRISLLQYCPGPAAAQIKFSLLVIGIALPLHFRNMTLTHLYLFIRPPVFNLQIVKICKG